MTNWKWVVIIRENQKFGLWKKTMNNTFLPVPLSTIKSGIHSYISSWCLLMLYKHIYILRWPDFGLGHWKTPWVAEVIKILWYSEWNRGKIGFWAKMMPTCIGGACCSFQCPFFVTCRTCILVLCLKLFHIFFFVEVESYSYIF